MSRPPVPHPTRSTGGSTTADTRRLEYLPLEFADLLALEEQLAATTLGRPAGDAEGDASGADFAHTFMELSALVGHVLSVYQRYDAGESFISTAQAPSNLVRHAHRLAYDPDPGLAATGHVVLFAKPGLSGTIPAGLPLKSVPLGESKAEEYETGDALPVDAALNRLVPLHARRPVTISAGDRDVRVEGVGLGLEPGDRVALVGPRRQGFVVREATELPGEGVTVVSFDVPVGANVAVGGGPVLLADPATTLRPFGSDADPALYPVGAIRAATKDAPSTGNPRFWYTVERANPAGYQDADVYLSQKVADDLTGGYVLWVGGGTSSVLSVKAQAQVAVTLNRRAEETVPINTVNVVPKQGGGYTVGLADASLMLEEASAKSKEPKHKSPKAAAKATATASSSTQASSITQVVTGHISGTVTALQLAGIDQQPVTRSAQPLPADLFTGWRVEAPLAVDEPNPAPAVEPLVLAGALPALTPGRPLVFGKVDGSAVQVVSVRRASIDTQAETTSIWWDPVTVPPPGGWFLDDLYVLGNVVRVSHGRTVDEVVGGSDGITPFQRFALRESPVTVLPGVDGGEPELEVRVDGVLWARVQDFAASGPDDRHYRSVTDDQAVTSVVFGDGRNGAVPPSGKRNVVAVYRVGLGTAGDVEAGRLSRLKRAHPLLDHAVNVTPVSGGAERADAEAIRAQATRFIRTFDRAVSAADLADLALTMPGVARASSRWDPTAGAVVVVATASGDAPPALLGAVRAFLDARRDDGVPLRVLGPRPRAVRIALTLEADPAYLVEVVKNAVRASLHSADPASPGMFTFAARSLGQPAFRSEVYARLEPTPGVIGVRVDGFEADGTDPVASVITAGVDEWLRLDPNDLTVGTTGGATA